MNYIKLVDQNATVDIILRHYQEKEEKVEVEMSANPDSSSNTFQVSGKPKLSFKMYNVVIYYGMGAKPTVNTESLQSYTNLKSPTPSEGKHLHYALSQQITKSLY